MAEYIFRHRARYSSANNHLIIEMAAVCLAGIVCRHEPWAKPAIKILTGELEKQNFEDGVNKEMSLHYQSFIMEAYGLLIIVMEHNRMKIPLIWYSYLNKMSEFLADSSGIYGETVVFGDNDEGKVLDLNGRIKNYYVYVLDLMGCILERRFTDLENVHENIVWLVSKEKLEACRKKEKYIPSRVRVYEKGGYTFIRGKDKRILIGIDHAPLGFGKMAAHGHADALSFQLFIEGTSVFADPGTYNYHVPANARALFRATAYHNTVNVDGKNQSEILGPFLWGRQAETRLLNVADDTKGIELTAETCCEDTVHKRTFRYCDSVEEKAELDILDQVWSSNGINGEAVFLLHPDICEIESRENTCRFIIHDYLVTMYTEDTGWFKQERYDYSPAYGSRVEGIKVSFCWKIKEQAGICTKIRIEKR